MGDEAVGPHARLNEPTADNIEADVLKNEESYAEMIEFLNDQSLSLIMREADTQREKGP